MARPRIFYLKGRFYDWDTGAVQRGPTAPEQVGVTDAHGRQARLWTWVEDGERAWGARPPAARGLSGTPAEHAHSARIDAGNAAKEYRRTVQLVRAGECEQALLAYGFARSSHRAMVRESGYAGRKGAIQRLLRARNRAEDAFALACVRPGRQHRIWHKGS